MNAKKNAKKGVLKANPKVEGRIIAEFEGKVNYDLSLREAMAAANLPNGRLNLDQVKFKPYGYGLKKVKLVLLKMRKDPTKAEVRKCMAANGAEVVGIMELLALTKMSRKLPLARILALGTRLSMTKEEEMSGPGIGGFARWNEYFFPKLENGGLGLERTDADLTENTLFLGMKK